MNEVELPCPVCQVINKAEISTPVLINQPYASIILFEHPEPVTCMCGATFTVSVADVPGARLTATLLPKHLHKSKILSPSWTPNLKI